jgi:phage terminase large subunit
MRALEDRLEEYWDHPAKMVREIFGAEPDPWQEEALELFPTTPRIAMKACKGPGKSTVLAWLAWNYLLTRPHPKIAATSISATNLADGLWSEMAKWQAKSDLLKAKFTWTKTRIFSWPLAARAAD